jgi:alpha-N-acetylglucosaminidase
MLFPKLLAWAFAAIATSTAQSTDGILNLVKRRLPDHVDNFTFRLLGNETGPITSATNATNDQYIVSSIALGKIQIEGNSLIALASGRVQLSFRVTFAYLKIDCIDT